MRKRTLLLLVALTALAACQAEPEPQDVVGVTINLHDIHYDLETIEVAAGDLLVLTVINKGTLEHDFVINELPTKDPPHVHTMEAAGMEHDHSNDPRMPGEPALHIGAAPGTISTATLTPTEPGRYSFYCSVAGHREAGMEGILIVTEGD